MKKEMDCMRVLVIKFDELEGMDSTWKGFTIRNRLRSAGFDLSKTMTKDYDKDKREFTYKQAK
jgi:hypothetical protein